MLTGTSDEQVRQEHGPGRAIGSPGAAAVPADNSLEGVIDAIYRPMVDPAAWSDCLARLARWFDCDGAYLAFWDRRERLLNVSHMDRPMTEADLRRLRRYEALAGTDPRLDAVLRACGRVMTGDMTMPNAEFKKTQVYRHVLCEAQIENSMAVAVPAPRGHAIFCLTRTNALSGFHGEDCDDFEQFVPHLARAVAMARQTAAYRLERQIGWHLLDRLPDGVLVVDARGTVLCQNRVAERICRDRPEIRLRNGRFCLAGREDQDRLQRGLADAAAAPDTARTAALAITRDGSDRPITVVIVPVAPVPDGEKAPLEAVPRAVLLVSDPAAAPQPRGGTMRALFGLTQSESRLVDALMAAPNLADAAEVLGMSKNTARQHLKNIFQKTRTNSQSQLLRLALAVPGSDVTDAFGPVTLR